MFALLHLGEVGREGGVCGNNALCGSNRQRVGGVCGDRASYWSSNL